ncbi:MAG: hypothetical protein KKF74_02085 [Nanoarchaeota archaeon]|nr:hypothetical protein [Nanoarchaeota archaeon]
MSQNRNKLIDLFIGNISNSAVHMILEKAIDEDNLRKHYDKEFSISLNIAKSYREKINPKNTPFHGKEIKDIKDRIIKKVRAELNLRISKGYQNINIGLIEATVNKILKKIKVI